MQRHVRRITRAPNAGGIDLGSVQVLHRAQTDGPSDRVDVDGGNGGVGGGPVFRVDVDGHIDGEVHMAETLHGETGKEAAAPAEEIDQAPGEDYGEDKLDDAVNTRRDQRRVVAMNAGVRENLSAVSM